MGTVTFILQCLYLGWYQDDFHGSQKKALLEIPPPSSAVLETSTRKVKAVLGEKKGANTCCSNSQKWINYFGWAQEHQSGKSAQTFWLRFRQLRGLIVGCVRILHVFCSQPTSLLRMQTAWMHCGKLEVQTKVLLWNKCSRVQGLQLEKVSGEAALGEIYLWFQWKGAAKEGVFVWSGETWAQNRSGGKAWPQSCLCFSENTNWVSESSC